jgi:hypothetical protein
MDHDDVDEDRFIINYDDNDVNGMIRAVMTDHPEGASSHFTALGGY